MANQIIIFDLDDTLYLERDFAFSGFQAVGRWVDETYGIKNFSDHCSALFSSGLYQKVFDRALLDMGFDVSPTLIHDLINVYRTHDPKISLASDAKRYLDNAIGIKKLGIITDGSAQTQSNKIKALGLETKMNWIVRTGVWGKDYWKPHPKSFEEIEMLCGVSPYQITYVADNPLKDFLTPNIRGWVTVQILRKHRIHQKTAPSPEHTAQAQIKTLDTLDICLAGF